jgi:transcriptional regulator with XRE-family HTH domain
MKLTITKDWFLSRAHLEEGLEIGAGSLQYIGRPALHVAPASASDPTSTHHRQSFTFGRFVEVMRRKGGWTVAQLAKVAGVTPEEMRGIESDPHHQPELRTVQGLARAFHLPPKSLVKLAGLSPGGSLRLREERVRDAGGSESNEPLSDEEDAALQAFLKVIVEDSDP